MKFEVQSAAHCYDYPDKYIDILNTYCTYKDGSWYIEVKYICELQPLLEAIQRAKDELYKNVGWDPTSVVIDFQLNIITIHDGYIE